MKLYLITGSSGLVGTNLLRQLDQENDVKIVALINRTPLHYKSEKIEEVKCNILDYKTIDDIFSKYNYEEKICIHCAGIITIKSKNSSNVSDVNINGTKNIIDACKKYNYKLIYVSSVDAMEKPTLGKLIVEPTEFNTEKLKGDYSKTKAIATSLVLDSNNNGVQASVVLPSAIIGPYDYNKGHFTNLIEMYVNNKLPAIVKGGYDFVDVRDVVDGIINISKKNKYGECYLLTNKYYTVKELINTLSKVTNKKKVKFTIPTCIIKLLAPMFEWFSNIRKSSPLFTPYSIYVINTNAIFSHNKATKDLDYNPRSLEVTLKDTYEWICDK